MSSRSNELDSISLRFSVNYTAVIWSCRNFVLNSFYFLGFHRRWSGNACRSQLRLFPLSLLRVEHLEQPQQPPLQQQQVSIEIANFRASFVRWTFTPWNHGEQRFLKVFSFQLQQRPVSFFSFSLPSHLFIFNLKLQPRRRRLQQLLQVI